VDERNYVNDLAMQLIRFLASKVMLLLGLLKKIIIIIIMVIYHVAN
jgi:hypothetical protein